MPKIMFFKVQILADVLSECGIKHYYAITLVNKLKRLINISISQFIPKINQQKKYSLNFFFFLK